MSACIDANPATDALAKILYGLIDLNEGGSDLADAAREVETLFKRADIDFGKWTLDKLEVLRVDADTHELYRALQKIAKLKTSSMGDRDAFHSAIAIAEESMRKARGETPQKISPTPTKPPSECVCGDCRYFHGPTGYNFRGEAIGECYAQKDAPTVEMQDESCDSFDWNSEVNHD